MPDYQIHADYDQDGRISGHPNEYARRHTPPGGILAANLDVDSRRRADFVSGAGSVDLDWQRATKSRADDDLLRLVVRVPEPAPLDDTRLYLRVTGWLQNRIRIYDSRGRPLTRVRSMSNVYPILLDSAEHILRLEAQTLPGSPLFMPSTLGTRTPPLPSRHEEGPFRLELYSIDATGNRRVLDRACFTVAPLIFCDVTCSAETVYVCEIQDAATASSAPSLRNHPTLVDLETALRGTGVRIVRIPHDQCQLDGWIQDQFKMGYCHTPCGVIQLALHFPRMHANAVPATEATSSLPTFVRSYFPSHQVGVFQELWDRSVTFLDAQNNQQSLRFQDSYPVLLTLERIRYFRYRLVSILARYDPEEAGRRTVESMMGETLTTLPSLVRSTLHENQSARAETLSSQRREFLDEERRFIEEQYRRIRASIGIHRDRIAVRMPGGTIALTIQQFTRLRERLQQMHSLANFGGNILVSPPISDAPLGKIVIGNARTRTTEFVDPDLRRLLRRQYVQPLVEINTGWLQVGHIDELITFVPARARGEEFAILRASPATAFLLLEEALTLHLHGLRRNPEAFPVARDLQEFLEYRPLAWATPTNRGSSPLTLMLRGKSWLHRHPAGSFAEIVPPNLYGYLAWYYRWLYEHTYPRPCPPFQQGEGVDRHYPAKISVHEYLSFENGTNAGIETPLPVSPHTTEPGDASAAIIDTVNATLAAEFPRVPILGLPVLFDDVFSLEEIPTSALTPNLVNMQVIGNRLVVPRPFGPRMRVNDAISVLRAVFQQLSLSALEASLTERYFNRRGLVDPRIWMRDSTVRAISREFRDGFPEDGLARIERLLREANRRRNPFQRNGTLRPGWHQIIIPEGTVDLFEAYTQIVLESLGLEVSWADTWFYHVHGGEIHCGTNVVRRPELRTREPWWRRSMPHT